MREFIFRAWDKEENRFWYFKLQEVLKRRMVYRGSWDEKILEGEKTEFTGLKDSKLVDIYECDIVKYGKYLGIVKYRLGEFIVEWQTGYFRKDLRYWCKQDGFEVIGNIYENKELLEGE